MCINHFIFCHIKFNQNAHKMLSQFSKSFSIIFCIQVVTSLPIYVLLPAGLEKIFRAK